MFRRGKLSFLSTKDDRIKLVNERINLTEKHLNELRGGFIDCTRRLAKQRDSYDELAKAFKMYAEDEEINESLSEGMKSFTNATTILADYMDMQVRRLEQKIVGELAQCDAHCKTTRDSLRTAVVARDKEVLKQRQMLEIKSKFAANNSAADSELLKAKLEVNRANKKIDDIINNFEKRKLSDLKVLLTNFILISMRFHTKALEALSASYYDVSNIDERCDLMEFQKLMKTKDDAQTRKASSLRKKGGLRSSQSMEHLERNELLSPMKRRSRLSRSSKNLADAKDGHDDDDDEDDDDDVDDDDEDDDDDDEDSEDGSSQQDEDDSGSLSEDEENEATTGKRIKSSKSKIQLDPFKAATAATHLKMQKKKHKQSIE